MDDVTPAPCNHEDWVVTGGDADMNPPKVEVTCHTCGATQMVGEVWLLTRPAVVAAARVATQQHMIRSVEETL